MPEKQKVSLAAVLGSWSQETMQIFCSLNLCRGKAIIQ